MAGSVGCIWAITVSIIFYPFLPPFPSLIGVNPFPSNRAIYEKLSDVVPEEQRAVYKQRVEDISPNMRYCAYNIGESTDINQLMAMRNVSDVLASEINVHT